jgi:hypothetical protein
MDHAQAVTESSGGELRSTFTALAAGHPRRRSGGAMEVSGWRTSLVVHAVDVPSGQEVSVVVGLIETAAGGLQVAMRVGEDGNPMVLTLQEAAQLELNVRGVLAERYRIAIEGLGGDAS